MDVYDQNEVSLKPASLFCSACLSLGVTPFRAFCKPGPGHTCLHYRFILDQMMGEFQGRQISKEYKVFFPQDDMDSFPNRDGNGF